MIYRTLRQLAHATFGSLALLASIMPAVRVCRSMALWYGQESGHRMHRPSKMCQQVPVLDYHMLTHPAYLLILVIYADSQWPGPKPGPTLIDALTNAL